MLCFDMFVIKYIYIYMYTICALRDLIFLTVMSPIFLYGKSDLVSQLVGLC